MLKSECSWHYTLNGFPNLNIKSKTIPDIPYNLHQVEQWFFRTRGCNFKFLTLWYLWEAKRVAASSGVRIKWSPHLESKYFDVYEGHSSIRPIMNRHDKQVHQLFWFRKKERKRMQCSEFQMVGLKNELTNIEYSLYNWAKLVNRLA